MEKQDNKNKNPSILDPKVEALTDPNSSRKWFLLIYPIKKKKKKTTHKTENYYCKIIRPHFPDKRKTKKKKEKHTFSNTYFVKHQNPAEKKMEKLIFLPLKLH